MPHASPSSLTNDPTPAQRWASVWCKLGFWWRNGASLAAKTANRRTYTEPAEVSHTAIGALWQQRHNADELTALEQSLLQRYPHLGEFRRFCSQQRYMETLTHLHFLDNLLPKSSWNTAIPPLQDAYRWLDVGAKNWAYLEALTTTANRLPTQATAPWKFTGIEIDPNRLYRDGFTRGAYARTFTNTLLLDNTTATYVEGDALAHTSHYHVISHFLPFVVPEPCLLWGLPLESFQPKRLLHHAWQQLAPGGHLLIINQGRDEADAQQALLNTLPDAIIAWHGKLPSSFINYEYPRFGWRITKPMSPTTP